MSPVLNLSAPEEAASVDTPEVEVRINRRAKRLSLTLMADGRLRVTMPSGVNRETAMAFMAEKREWIEKSRARQQARQQRARDLLKKKQFDPETAKKRLRERIQELARRHELPFNRLSLRRQRSRWGSCSAANDISLNLKLDLLPTELSDLVILHELAHTRFKNHGPRFHQLLEKLLPGAGRLSRELNHYSGLLRLPELQKKKT